MKKSLLFLTLVFIITSLASCGSSPYKKRKGCKGQGSWSGNRNLGFIDKIQKEQQKHNTYVFHEETINTEG